MCSFVTLTLRRVSEDFISNDAVPFIKTSLGNIAGAVQNITTKVTPYVVGVVKPLTDDELANVPVLLGKTKALADGLKDYATTLLSGLSTGTSYFLSSFFPLPLSSFPGQGARLFLGRGTHRGRGMPDKGREMDRN